MFEKYLFTLISELDDTATRLLIVKKSCYDLETAAVGKCSYNVVIK